MKRTFILAHDQARQRAQEAVRDAPDGWRVSVDPPKRSLAQNAKFHALCTDLAKSNVEWAWRRRDLVEWKVLLISGHATATKGEAEPPVYGLEGELVSLRESSAAMDVPRGSSLIEYTLAFCAMHGVETREYARVMEEVGTWRATQKSRRPTAADLADAETGELSPALLPVLEGA